VLVRESTEGLFYARGRGDVRSERGVETEVYDTMKITRHGTARICEFAFKLAERRAAAPKAAPAASPTLTRPMCFRPWRSGARFLKSRPLRHHGVAADSAYVDAMALNLVMKPWTYDVLVTENMFGDILSDLIAALVGGMGMAPSGDIGDKHGLFQPAHGTAPDIAGQGKANPTAMMLSAAMMLDWLADRTGDTRLADGAALIERAVEQVFSHGQHPTHRVRWRQTARHDITSAVHGCSPPAKRGRLT
jgi:3-isopropylmalate dehydrogenase